MTATSITPARVRFAPSPTGFLHLGGLRTALFDWLYARHTGGQFILRIEDTDQKRYNPESLTDLMRSLRWLGLEWDEGPDVGGPHAPYIQSERRAIYRQYADWLVDHGKAYRCYTTEAELEELRAKGLPYDRRHRNLPAAQRAAFEAEGRTAVIRFAAPLTGTTTVYDAIRGDITVENTTIADPVLLKSDGLPTYHLAVVVDDRLMEITHVLRGEEWIPSAPLHQLLFEAFAWPAPVFVHLPVILDPSGKGKMSKRKTVVDGREFSPYVRDYMTGGYLADAMFNFLANMGWSFDAEREIFTRDEAVERFDVANISPKATALPFGKLDWMNGVYIRQLEAEKLADALAPYVAADLGLAPAALRHDRRLIELAPLVQERIKVLTEATALVDWAFVTADQITYPDPTQLIGKKLSAAESRDALEAGAKIIQSIEPFAPPALEAAFRTLSETMQIKVGSLLTPFRVALTGKTVAPPLFESMHVLGREETLARIANASEALRALAATAA